MIPAISSVEGELLTPRDMVRAVGRTHPLAGGRVDCLVRAGSSISEILIEALSSSRPDMRLRRDFVVHVDGDPVPETMWSHVRVKRGATVTFSPRLQNSGVVRSVLSVVVAIAAIAVAGPLAGTLTIAGFALTGTALTIATAVIAGGLMLAGTLAINALFPVRPPADPESINSTRLNSIQGARNQADPFGAIPVVLGKSRQSPRMAAKPYTEIVGDDQYLRMLFCFGYGPLLIENIRIGETPIGNYEAELELRQGFVGDAPITLYPGTVDELALAVTLTNTVDPPGNFVNGGAWETQITSAETDQISVDFTAPQGAYLINQNGNLDGYGITANVRYRLVGAVGWTNAPDVTIGRSTGPTRAGAVYTVARGQYEVQARKMYGDAANDKIKDELVWTAIRSIKNVAPINFPKPLALLAVRIKATDQLSGVLDTLNADCTSLVNAWRGGVWTPNLNSQYPHDLFRHVLQGPANARPQGDDKIDIEALQAWGDFCFANDFKFNQVITSAGSVYDKLADIAAAGRARVSQANGKWGVIWDQPDASIVQHFTPRNSWGFQGQKPYAQQPHGWRVPFINEANGYTQDERIVYDDGYNAGNATLFEGMQFPGITDPALIYRHGRFHIAQSRLRPEKFSLNTGWEHLICTAGDRVRVTHDVPLIGLASGRIKSIAGQVVTFDEQVTLEDGIAYGMQFRVPQDARTVDRDVDPATPGGDYKALTLLGDLSALEDAIAAGSFPLFGFGVKGQESADYRVFSIGHQKDLIAVLTLVDDAPEISEADQGEIPEYDPHVTIPPDPFTLPPRDLRYQEVIDGQGAAVRALLRLTWQVPRFGRIRSFEVQLRDDGAGGAFRTVDSVPAPRTSCDVPLIAAGVWSVRVRCVFNDGTVSAWASLLGLNLSGLTFAPGDVTNLHRHAIEGQTVLDWTPVVDQRILFYEVRKGTSWDTGLVVGPAVPAPPWPTTGDGTYHVRAYIMSPFGVRIYSVATASITISDSIITRNVIISKDEQALGWPGALDGGVIDGSFIRTDIGEVITSPIAQDVIDQLELEGLHIAVYISPTTVNIGRPAECRFWTLFEASGILQGDDFLGQADVLGSADILGTSPTRNIVAFPIWRFATEGEDDIFAPGDVFDPTDIFTGNVLWGEWVATASGTRVERFFQPGLVLITNAENTDAVGTKFSWFVDVPDRLDSYTNLAVPDTGLPITFYPGGFDAVPGSGTATPFNGGPNGALVPHIQRAIVEATNGDEVKITDLTLTGCTVWVVNAGVNVTRDGVNILALGY